MKQRPIPLKQHEVLGILDCRQSQLRRIVKPAKDRNGSGCPLAPCEIAGEVNSGDYSLCPYGRPGDQLWGRESWWHDAEGGDASNEYGYLADGNSPGHGANDGHVKHRPSTQMPRWASRITLEIVSVRVERLQDINADGEEAEGIDFLIEDPSTVAGQAFNEAEHYSIAGVPMEHSPERFGTIAHFRAMGMDWDANHWVWVVEFKKVEP